MDDTRYVFSLDAVPRRDLAAYTQIFNIHDMEYYLWVKVDPVVAKEYSLYGLDEVDSTAKYDLTLADFCDHEPNRIWYRFNSMMLNRDAGQHVYRMHFVHRQDDTTISLYFSYIVQREDTNKEYLYMPRDLQKQKERVKL